MTLFFLAVPFVPVGEKNRSTNFTVFRVAENITHDFSIILNVINSIEQIHANKSTKSSSSRASSRQLAT
ncbi:MAG: hypothetical protein ACK53Y_13090, partial [bacterium]